MEQSRPFGRKKSPTRTSKQWRLENKENDEMGQIIKWHFHGPKVN